MTYTGKEHPALVAGAVATIMLGYAAIKAGLPADAIKQVRVEALTMFPDHNTEEVAILLQVMNDMAQEALNPGN